MEKEILPFSESFLLVYIFVSLCNLKRKEEEDWREKEDRQPISYVGVCGKGALK